MNLVPGPRDVPRLSLGAARTARRSARMICDIYTPDGKPFAAARA